MQRRPATSDAALQRLRRARLQPDPAAASSRPTAPARRPATTSPSTATARRCSNPATRASSQVKKAVVTLPEGMTRQPLGRRRPRHLHGGPVRGRDGHLGARRRLPQRLQDRRADGRKPARRRRRSKARCSSPPRTRTPSAPCSPSTWSPRRPSAGSWSRSPAGSTPTRRTGQLTTTFDDLPQLPYSHFNVHFREGQRSPLATPVGLRHLRHRGRHQPLARPEPSSCTSPRPSRSRPGIGGGPCPHGPRRPSPRAPTAAPLNAQRRLLHALLPAPDPHRRRAGDHLLLGDPAARACSARSPASPSARRRRSPRPSARPAPIGDRTRPARRPA